METYLKGNLFFNPAFCYNSISKKIFLLTWTRRCRFITRFKLRNGTKSDVPLQTLTRCFQNIFWPTTYLMTSRSSSGSHQFLFDRDFFRQPAAHRGRELFRFLLSFPTVIFFFFNFF